MLFFSEYQRSQCVKGKYSPQHHISTTGLFHLNMTTLRTRVTYVRSESTMLTEHAGLSFWVMISDTVWPFYVAYTMRQIRYVWLYVADRRCSHVT